MLMGYRVYNEIMEDYIQYRLKTNQLDARPGRVDLLCRVRPLDLAGCSLVLEVDILGRLRDLDGHADRFGAEQSPRPSRRPFPATFAEAPHCRAQLRLSGEPFLSVAPDETRAVDVEHE